jgi:heptosyltransferase-2
VTVSRRHKILIVKLGYSETLAPQMRTVCSLGDVFRTTVLLHLFKDDHVTWLTDAAAVPLLQGNPHIDRLLVFDTLSVLQLQQERFDKVINLEKVPGVCALVTGIEAWAHYGFRFDAETGEAQAYERAHEALAVATREDVKRLNDRPWAAVLYSALGHEWHGESYILGYEPAGEVTHDLGFNMHVGRLMPVKAWPPAHWDELERLCEGRYTVSRQRHLDDLTGYMDWIHSCRMLITNDSLGLYLGVAMGRKVLGLFGPTSVTEQSPHPNLRIIRPDLDRECMPCCAAECALGDPCMAHLSPREVLQAVEEWGAD